MMRSEVKQIVDNAEKMPLARGLEYLSGIIRDLNIERADMMINRRRKTKSKDD